MSNESMDGTVAGMMRAMVAAWAVTLACIFGKLRPGFFSFARGGRSAGQCRSAGGPAIHAPGGRKGRNVTAAVRPPGHPWLRFSLPPPLLRRPGLLLAG
jgi:hypothetical protein